MDDTERFNETLMPEKEELNMKDITDADYMYARVCKDSKIKNLGEYHDLYLKGNAEFFADVF